MKRSLKREAQFMFKRNVILDNANCSDVTSNELEANRGEWSRPKDTVSYRTKKTESGGSRVDRQSEEVSLCYYRKSDVSFWGTDGSG